MWNWCALLAHLFHLGLICMIGLLCPVDSTATI
jgi:hypothetical protein